MRYIQAIAISRPITTTMFYLALSLLGVISFQKLEISLLPELNFPRLTIVTLYTNAAPEEIESLITKPISESIGTVGGVKNIESQSLEGASIITIQFDWNTNIDYAVMEMRERLDMARNLLPDEAGRSIISRFDPSEEPIMEMVFFPSGLNAPDHLRDFVETEIKPEFDRIDGVAYAELSGGFQREIQVELDASLLQSYNLTPGDVSERIKATNVNIPAGSITVGNQDILIRTLGQYRQLEDIENTVVGRNAAGVPVLLRYVAVVKNGFKERKGLARYNGKECVVLSVHKEAGKNTVRVAADIYTSLVEIRKRFDEEVSIQVVHDESIFVSDSIFNIMQSLVLGGVLAFLVLILILRELRSPVILVSILPVALLSTIILMYISGISLNMMSLGGMALGIGMLFDSGNVVLSAMQRHSLAGLPASEAALKGASEVTGSISAAVLTTIIVFLPIVFIESIVGLVFKEMALTITFSLVTSLIVSLTLIPMLYSTRLLGNVKIDHFAIIRKAEAIEHRIHKTYQRLLQKILRNSRPFIIILLILSAFAVLTGSFVHTGYIPQIDTGQVSIHLQSARNSSLDYTTHLVSDIESVLMESEEVEHVVSRVGYNPEEILAQDGSNVGTHYAEIKVILNENRGISSEEWTAGIRKKLPLRSDLKISYETSGDILTEILSPGSRPVELNLSGDELDILTEQGNLIRNKISAIPGVVDASTSLDKSSNEFILTFDSDRMAKANLTNRYLSGFLAGAIEGERVTRLRVADEEFNIRLRMRKRDTASLTDVNNMPLYTERNGTMDISQFIHIEHGKGHNAIFRSGSSRINRITADIQNRDIDTTLAEIENSLRNLNLPPGYSIQIAGEKEQIEESFSELSFAFALAAVLIYMLLSSMFQSYKFSALMMLAIPLVFTGVLPALFVSGKNLNVSSFTGLILLAGIVVDNSVLYFEYLKIFREEGLGRNEAVIGAGSVVLRPIIMNNSTTILALLPIAIELGRGTEFQSPMAITVIAGLCAAVFISLFLIPIVFYKSLPEPHSAPHPE